MIQQYIGKMSICIDCFTYFITLLEKGNRYFLNHYIMITKEYYRNCDCLCACFDDCQCSECEDDGCMTTCKCRCTCSSCQCIIGENIVSVQCIHIHITDYLINIIDFNARIFTDNKTVNIINSTRRSLLKIAQLIKHKKIFKTLSKTNSYIV